MKHIYKIVYQNGEEQEVEASGVFIALVRSGAILRDDEVMIVTRMEQLSGAGLTVADGLWSKEMLTCAIQ